MNDYVFKNANYKLNEIGEEKPESFDVSISAELLTVFTVPLILVYLAFAPVKYLGLNWFDFNEDSIVKINKSEIIFFRVYETIEEKSRKLEIIANGEAKKI